MSLLDADVVHPITLPDGSLYTDTVYLTNVINYPRIEVGIFSYYTHSGRPEHTARILAPYLGHGVRERLITGKFVQIPKGSYFITSSANHPMDGFAILPLCNIGRTRPELPPGNVGWPWQQYRFAIRSLRNHSKFRDSISRQLAAVDGLPVWHIKDPGDLASAIDDWRNLPD